MSYEDAMYNCLLRRATLVSFETDSELNKYWYNSSYFQNAFDTGLSFSGSRFFPLKMVLSQKFFIIGQVALHYALCKGKIFFGVPQTQPPMLHTHLKNGKVLNA
jgi:hypothetical protein